MITRRPPRDRCRYAIEDAVPFVDDVINALHTQFTQQVPGSSFADNEAMDALPREAELIDPIEAVLTDGKFPAEFKSNHTVRRNVSGLLEIYFRLADSVRHDSVPFLERLDPEIRHEAFRKILQIWGSNAYNRLPSICCRLYRYFCDSLGPDEHWTAVLNRYQRIGKLTLRDA